MVSRMYGSTGFASRRPLNSGSLKRLRGPMLAASEERSGLAMADGLAYRSLLGVRNDFSISKS
jgi:hypothetical protein